jgi:hypothetical protein
MLTGIKHSEAVKIVIPNRKKWDTYHPFFFRGKPFHRQRLMRRIAKATCVWIKRVPTKTKLRDLKHNAQVSVRWIGRDGNMRAHSVVWDIEKKRVICPDRKKPRPLSFYEKHKVMMWEFVR